MICRSCGTEIADKAIVCYRCGTGTKEPLRKPAEIRRRRSPIWVAIVVIILMLLAWLLARNYQLFGLDLLVLDPPSWSVAVLVDFAPGHA